MIHDHSRRRFLHRVIAGVALIPLVHLGSRPAFAAEKVTEDEPTAQALKYVADIDAADIQRPDKAGTPGSEQYCHNCGLYQGEEDWGPCTIFQNRLVAGTGWCSAWVPRAA